MTVAQLRATLARVAAIPEPAIRAASQAVEDVARAEGGTVTLGRKHRRVTLKGVSRVKRSGDRIVATVWGVPTGPWVWKDTGTAPHLIPTRAPTRRRPRPMHGQGFAHPVARVQLEHPGTGGRGAWDRVVTRAEQVVPDTIRAHVRGAIRGR